MSEFRIELAEVCGFLAMAFGVALMILGFMGFESLFPNALVVGVWFLWSMVILGFVVLLWDVISQ